MKIRIEFYHNKDNFLPFDYPAKIQAWIYSTLWKADPDFATWLHEQGYSAEESGKTFKLFNFGAWRCKPYTLVKNNGLLLQSGRSTLDLGFYIPQDAKKFISGLFEEQQGYMQLGKDSWDFNVGQVQVLPEPTWSNTMQYTTQTPIVIARAKQEDEKHEQYVSIDTPKNAIKYLDTYKKLFINNLISKTQAAIPDWDRAGIQPQLKIDSTVKKQRMTLKNTTVIGQKLTFTLTAPLAMQQVGYYAGFGKNTSMGCGFCEIVNRKV